MLRRLFVALALALVLASFGAICAASPDLSLRAGLGPTVICNGSPSPC